MNNNYFINLVTLYKNTHYILNNIILTLTLAFFILTLTLAYGYTDGYLEKMVGYTDEMLIDTHFDYS